MGPWELQWRMKAQIQWTQFELPEKELRNRFLLGYEINKHLMPYLAAEYFLTADHAETSFREYRYMAGAEYELNKSRIWNSRIFTAMPGIQETKTSGILLHSAGSTTGNILACCLLFF